MKEITEFIEEYNYGNLLEIRNNYDSKYGWYTEEELENFMSLRKKREFESLTLEEKKELEKKD